MKRKSLHTNSKSTENISSPGTSDDTARTRRKSSHPTKVKKPDSSPTFEIMKLPRELRERVYEYHLEDSCKESKVHSWSNWYHYPYHGQEDQLRLSVGGKDSATRPAFFFEPIYIRFRTTDQSNMYSTHEARVCSLPPLTQLKGTQIGHEAWMNYVNKFVVHTDALNRFQTWCLETLEEDRYLSLRRLHVVSRAAHYIDRHQPGTVTPIYGDESSPTFLIQISADQKSITLSSRFPLTPVANATLLGNLDILMAQRLGEKGRLNGEDLLEVMFALHNHVRLGKDRPDLVVGPLRKGTVTWPFVVDERELEQFSEQERDDEDAFKVIMGRSRRLTHVIYRGEVSSGKQSA